MVRAFACRPRGFAGRRLGRCLLGCLLAALALALGPASVASAHSAFLGSTPEPGQRLGSAPAQIALTFTEPLDRRLSTASLTDVRSGKHFPARASFSSSRQLGLRPTSSLGRAAFRVDWHTGSTLDGHALEGAFCFGVGVDAAGGEHSVQQSPLARDGWLRILARVGLYTTLLLFAGALLLRAVRRPRSGWPVPERLALPDLKLNALRRRERNLVVDAGLFAAAF